MMKGLEMAQTVSAGSIENPFPRRGIFSPPNFADADQTRRAVILFWMAWGMLLISTSAYLTAALIQPANRIRFLILLFIVDSSHLIALKLNAQGRVRLATLFILGVVYGVIMGGAWTSGGFHGEALKYIPMLVFMSGLLLGVRGGVLAAVVCVLSAFGFVLAENNALLPVNSVHHSVYILWLSLTFQTALFLLVQTLVIGGLERALASVRSELVLRQESEQALRSSRQNYYEIFNATNEAIFIHDAETGRILDVNHSMLRMFGFDSKEEVLAQEIGSISEGSEPYSQRTAYERMQRAVNEGAQVFEWRARKKDGSLLWTEVSLRSSEIGGCGCILAVVRDISERKRAEEALLLSEANLKQAQSIAKLGHWELDLRSNRLLWSDAIFEIFEIDQGQFGASYEAFLGTIHPDDRTRVNEAYTRSLETRVPYSVEHRLQMDDGRIKWVREFCTTTYDEMGVPLNSVGIVQDITDRKHMEESLKQSEERLALATQAAQIGVWDWDIARGELVWDESMYRLHGLKRTDFKAAYDAWLACVHPGDKGRVDADIAAALRGEKEFGLEFRVVWPDGSVHHIQSASRTFRDEAGAPLRMIGTNIDITGTKLAEEARLRSEQQFRDLMEFSPLAMLVTDADLHIVFLNRKFTSVFGFTLEDIPSVPEWWTKAYPEPTYREQVRAEWEEASVAMASNGGHVGSPQHKVACKDGRVRDVRFGLAPVGPWQLMILEDVTEENQLEQQRRQSQKMEAIGQLAGGVAHDFNNMLSLMLGFSEMGLRETAPTHPAYTCFQEIINACTRATEIVRQLLGFSRQQQIAPTVVDINKSIDAISKMCRRLIGEDIQLLWQPCADSALVFMDPAQLDQIIMNLCVNARDAITGNGVVTARTDIVLLDKTFCDSHVGTSPGAYVRLSFGDDGAGMDRETLTRIFDPFFTTKGLGKGTGLGLSTVYGVVRQNAGAIEVDSAPGKGTLFRIYLPLCTGSTEKSTQIHREDAPRGRGELLLLVEDEPDILRIVQASLERSGYEVAPFCQPSAALQFARTHSDQIRMLVTDVIMPEMTGVELFEQIRGFLPGTKVLYMSGHTADVITERAAMSMGAHLIKKPFTYETLAITIRRILDAS